MAIKRGEAILQDEADEEEREEGTMTRMGTSCSPTPSPSSAHHAPQPDDTSSVVFLIEAGSRTIRAGFVEIDPHGPRKTKLVSASAFPCVVARPTRANADRWAMMRNAGMQAHPMFQRFRDSGVFVGPDARCVLLI